MNAELMNYKYNYDANVTHGMYASKGKLIAFILEMIALPVIILFFNMPVIVFGLLIWLVVVLFTLFGSGFTKRIILTPRYILCGNQVLYYHNITDIKLDNTAGKILMNCQEIQSSLVLYREKFPTNANKQHKIINNKNKKFKKVTEKILVKTREVNPHVNIEVIGTIQIDNSL